MSDSSQQPPQQPSQTLSEISHLFLSGIRDAQQPGQSRPVRTPPPKAQNNNIDLMADDAAVKAAPSTQPRALRNPAPRSVPVTVVLAGHLGGEPMDRVRQYASQLSEAGQRIGLVCVDSSALRLSLFDRETPLLDGAADEIAAADARVFVQSLDELAWDVDQWVLYAPSTRVAETRVALSHLSRWTLLSTCDHDGVVSSYRVLKGLSDLPQPELALVCIQPRTDEEWHGAFDRIDSVCQQFLGWKLEGLYSLPGEVEACEHVLFATGATSAAELTKCWDAILRVLAGATYKKVTAPIAPAASPAPRPVIVPQAAPVETAPVQLRPNEISAVPSVIELTGDESSVEAIAASVLAGGELQACTITPPMFPESRLALAADRRLVLVAVAKRGLSDLKLIGRAYQWLIENRGLIALALPQMSVDAHALPRLELLVDQTDLSTDLLQPLMASGSVVVSAYRKLRWGNRVGLLLDAA